MEIRVDDPRDDRIATLLREHLQSATRHSPPESCHALDVDALGAPGITFWAAWRDRELLGIGALLELDPRHGEVKSMKTATRHLRGGVAAAILRTIIAEGRRRGYERLSLETGSMEAFAPARALYARHGFVECGPFGEYREDPNSVFMTLALGEAGPS